MSTTAIDPVTLAVLNGRLEQIADEMDATLFRSAFNPIIAEAHDASHGLYEATSGETLVQGKSGLPIFVGTMAYAVKWIIDCCGEHFRDGDIFLFNDPYQGGTHLSDFKLVKPYYYRGELFCHLASVGHWHDVGGNVPGNYNPLATESFQEGMQIPPVRVVEGGELKHDIIAIVQANSRLPLSVYGDLHAQLNALTLGADRMTELLDEYGAATVRQTFTELRHRAAHMMADYIGEIPDGVYQAADFLDNDGIDATALKIQLDLTVTGRRLRLDFSGTSTACAGPVNISRSTAIASLYVALKHIFPEVPANGGVLDPVEINIESGSLLAAEAPKPVGGYTETILRVIDLVFQALAQPLPQRVNGCAYGTINALSLSGHRANGQRWVMFSFFGGGHGGHPRGDGLNHGNAPISMATIPPLEILEAVYPIKFTQWALRPDSGGAGKHRGGLGAIYELELLEEQADVFLFGDRGVFAPPGVAGGAKAKTNQFFYEQASKFHQPGMVSKAHGIDLRRGQKLRLETPGGGGYGAPTERSLEAIDADIALGYVSQEAALKDYPQWAENQATIRLR